ncbi:MAG: DUF881 domain-containing protein [Clostridia bacterium]|nr:DUF881 domain-containing protein [Clostridia bacterium]
MKKGKITMIITVGIACFALVCVMFMQFKIVNETDITSIETMREEELRTELANWKEKYKDVEQQYTEVQNKIEEYKNKKESNIETATLIKEELEQTQSLLGKTDIEGEGIEVTINEAADNDFDIIKASDLVSIVNSLKYAGAEAISINEQRILTMTDIVDISDTFIKINGQRILAPYVIKAVGNKSYLESSLVGMGGYVEQLRSIGHDVKITQLDKVLVKKYNGEINYKYISD